MKLSEIKELSKDSNILLMYVDGGHEFQISSMTFEKIEVDHNEFEDCMTLEFLGEENAVCLTADNDFEYPIYIGYRRA